MKRLMTVAIALCIGGCAASGRAMIYTEEGIRLAETEWDSAYRQRIEYCAEHHAAMTAGAEACFGSYFDADGKVETAVRSAVILLRSYWIARAAGQKPKWRDTAKQVFALFQELPPEAFKYFERVRGI